MSAARANRARMRVAWRALTSFLRGFVGNLDVVQRCDHDHEHRTTTPASIRHALEAQASRRGRCC